MSINTDSFLPISFAPLSQLGMKVAFGLDGLPSNRIIMCYGKPSSGKSTLLYQLAGEYDRQGDEVWIVDAERAIDRIYLSSYFHKDDTLEFKLEAIKYDLKASEKRLKEDAKAKDEDRTMSEADRKILERRIELLPILAKNLKEGTEEGMDKRTATALLRQATSEYRIRNVKIIKPLTMEDFEKMLIKMIDEKKEDPARRHKRLLIGVDSTNCLLTEDVLDRTVSSEGSNFTAAKYMHTFIPRLINKISGTETSIFFIQQQAETIKLNPWEQKSVIDDVATKGGSAAKFGATIMIGVMKKRKVEDFNGQSVDTGIIDIPKSKLRGGSKGTLKGKFYLKESYEESIMDFNEPFIADILAEEEMGIRKNRGSFYVPENLLKGHPQYDEIIAPRLSTFPKEEDNKTLYWSGKEKEVMDVLLSSPAFEEEVLLEHGILPAV